MTIDQPRKTQCSELRSLWQEAFDDTEEFLNLFAETAFSTERCRCVTVDGKVAAALYWFDCIHLGRPVAYLYAVATDRAYRGQGICHKLMEDTHRHLEKRGYEGTILVPESEELFRFYEGMGYQTCSQIREFACAGTKEEVQICRIDKEEYAELRRRFLPENSVVQEHENLDFLHTQVTFYKGDGFLLAAMGESDTLSGVELLGDEAAAPGIVYSLGYTKGSFRTPGKGVPFAMYRPVGESKLPPPVYFGLAFDY